MVLRSQITDVRKTANHRCKNDIHTQYGAVQKILLLRCWSCGWTNFTSRITSLPETGDACCWKKVQKV